MIIFTKDIAEALTAYLASKNYDKTYLVTDTNTRRHCLPLLEGTPALRDAGQITIEAGDIHKDIAQVAQIWQHLSDGGASRHSLLINLGGGMVTDLGGFAGATFKRGLHVLNIPTTLMASVDAAVGEVSPLVALGSGVMAASAPPGLLGLGVVLGVTRSVLRGAGVADMSWSVR